MDAITLVIGALATARLTRLVTRDRITHGARRWALTRMDQDGLWAYLIICDWCVSVYVAGAVTAALAWGPSWAVWVLTPFAFSHVAGYLASKEGEA